MTAGTLPVDLRCALDITTGTQLRHGKIAFVEAVGESESQCRMIGAKIDLIFITSIAICDKYG